MLITTYEIMMSNKDSNSRVVGVRLTQDEYNLIESVAQKQNLIVGNYLKRAAIEKANNEKSIEPEQIEEVVTRIVDKRLAEIGLAQAKKELRLQRM